VKGTEAPKLPANFDQLGAIQQEQAASDRDLARRWKAKFIPRSITGMLTMLLDLTDCGRLLVSVGGLEMVTPFPYVAV